LCSPQGAEIDPVAYFGKSFAPLISTAQSSGKKWKPNLCLMQGAIVPWHTKIQAHPFRHCWWVLRKAKDTLCLNPVFELGHFVRVRFPLINVRLKMPKWSILIGA